MSAKLTWTAPGGSTRSGELHSLPGVDAGGPAAVIVAGGEPHMKFARFLAAHLSSAGWPTLHFDVAAAVTSRSDRERTAEIEAALAALGAQAGVTADELALIGIGPGGAQAFLCACASRRVAALVNVCGPLVRRDLDADTPVQPLDMALNLTAPILIAYAEQDTSFGGADAAHAALRLQRAMRTVETLKLALPVPDILEAGSPGYDPDHAIRAVQGITTFLGASFDTQ